MLIKRRILVVCADRQRAFAALRALPRLVWHRQDWSLLRPSIRATKEWEADLKAAAVYCAGTADSTLRGRSDLFDIVVDRAWPARTPTGAWRTLTPRLCCRRAVDTSTIHVSEPAKGTQQPCPHPVLSAVTHTPCLPLAQRTVPWAPPTARWPSS